MLNSNSTVIKSIEIAASAGDVWGVLTEPAMIAHWMLGARVASTWTPGGEITFTGELNGKSYRDHGTILAIEPGRMLGYSHWAEFSGRPDLPENRTVVTLELEPAGDGTRLSVRHDGLHRYEEYGHANFFWGYALRDIKKLVEEGPDALPR